MGHFDFWGHFVVCVLRREEMVNSLYLSSAFLHINGTESASQYLCVWGGYVLQVKVRG